MQGKPVAAVSLQRTVMTAKEFGAGGASGRHFYGSRKQYQYLHDQLVKYHRTGGARKRALLLKIFTLCEKWLAKNEDKPAKAAKASKVDLLQNQVAEAIVTGSTPATNFDKILNPALAHQIGALVPMLVDIAIEFRAGGRPVNQEELGGMAGKCAGVLSMFADHWGPMNGAVAPPVGTQIQKDTVQAVLAESFNENCQAGICSDLGKWAKQFGTAFNVWRPDYDARLRAAFLLGRKESRDLADQAATKEPSYKEEPVRWLRWAKTQFSREEWLDLQKGMIEGTTNKSVKEDLKRIKPPAE